MIPPNPLEHLNAIKALYAKCIGPVCTRHDLTRMELDILLFLANNPRFDTATDIIEIRYLSKSQVSASVKSLEKSGYLRKSYMDDNRKTAHLAICEAAFSIIEDGRRAQERFLDIMLQGFTQEQLDNIREYNARMLENINTYLKEEIK